MQEEQDIQRIEAYLKKSLSDQERLLFERELASDDSLRKLYEQHKFFLDGVQGMKIRSFTDSLKQENRQYPDRFRRLRFLSIAAGILIIVFLLFLLQRPDPNEALALKYYEVPLADLQRSDRPAQDSPYLLGMIAFDRKHWSHAITEFQKIDTSYAQYAQAQYFLAHALTGAQRYPEAVALFREMSRRSSQYQEQAEWNAVLVQLRMHVAPDALREDLNRILQNPEHFYYDMALSLQGEILKAGD